MGDVFLDMTTSLDGFIAGPNDADGGLHDYFFSPSGATTQVIEEGFKTTGAIIMGRRAYDVGAAQDGFVDNPYDVPTFVLTHNVPKKVAKGAEAFIFVTDGIRLFDHLGSAQIEMESTRVIESSGVTHLRFRVVKFRTTTGGSA